jgi:hypothetical protein
LFILGSLLVDNIAKNVDFDADRLCEIVYLVKLYPKVLSSSEYIKVNRVVSYVTFILKEIYEYATAKTSDEVYVSQLKLIKKEIIAMEERIDRYKRLLN